MKKTDFFNRLIPCGGARLTAGENYITAEAPAGGGVCTEKFKSLEDCVTVNIAARTTAKEADVSFKLCSYDESGAETVIYAETLEKDNDNCCALSYSFDPVSLGVYKNSVSFSVFLGSESGAQLHIKDFYITEGVQLQDMAEAEAICNIIIDEKGEKSVQVKQNNGEVITVPLVPKRVVFIGNSILLGMFNTYGMCSTDPKSDYAYHVQQAILARNPSCTFKKLHGSAYEHSETDDSVENWLSNDNIYSQRPARESFDEDTDLAIIQMTDNVNTDKKVTVFKNGVDRFVMSIKDMCPKARLVWVYGWYNKFNSHERLLELSREHSIELVDISGLRCPENESYSGQLSLNAEGDEVVVKDTWITHPGNKGMRAIADKIIETLGIAER